MKNTRGIGRVYQPSYRDKRTGEFKECATWRVEYYVSGRRFNEKVDSTNRADAVRLLKQRLGDAAKGDPVGPQLDRTTLDDLITLVEADYQANSCASLDRVQQAAKHLRDFFGPTRKARDITNDQVTRYAAHRLEEKAKPSTVNYEMAVLRRGFRLARRSKRGGPCPEITMLRVDNAREGFFEADQFRAVLSRLPDYLKPVAYVAYITGWRAQSELLTRQWRHVDLNAGSDSTAVKAKPAKVACSRLPPIYVQSSGLSASTSAKSNVEPEP